MIKNIALAIVFALTSVISSANDFRVKIAYEQFDTEILLYIKIENASNLKKNFNAKVNIQSQNLSFRPIQKDYNQVLIVAPKTVSNFNFATLEYSVLSQSIIRLDLYQRDSLISKDSLTLDFPNSFKNDIEIDLGGLKIDRTRTPIGRSFFELFEKNWVSPKGLSDYTIEFEELPFRFRTTKLKVYLDGELVVDSFLKDNEEFIPQLLAFTIGSVRNKLSEKETRDDEIGGDWNGI